MKHIIFKNKIYHSVPEEIESDCQGCAMIQIDTKEDVICYGNSDDSVPYNNDGSSAICPEIIWKKGHILKFLKNL